MEIVDDTPRLIEIPKGVPIIDPLTGDKVNDAPSTFQRVSALRVNGVPNRSQDILLGRFPDGKAGTPVLGVRFGDVRVVGTLVVPTAPSADATPFSQADLDAAKAAGSEARAEDIRTRLGL